ncbi:hypothetical protein Bca52824_053066 [Brassica carinata]|uniref:Uncharacterized protein n=1 Tax=Brassica carinata TaxID=52824 RepID=A0A8X7R502_BRACI|nr:hypothetical protein Bca52824_053066 [Brassica carinata]
MKFSPYLSHHAKEIEIPPVNQVSARDRGPIPSRSRLEPNGGVSYAEVEEKRGGEEHRTGGCSN